MFSIQIRKGWVSTSKNWFEQKHGKNWEFIGENQSFTAINTLVYLQQIYF